jgi:hypothetical protein
MMASGIGAAMRVFGTTKTFFIDERELTGDLDELGEESYLVVAGGKEYLVTAHLMCLVPQFNSDFPAAGTRLRMDGRLFVIAGHSSDEVTLTLNLADPDAH